MTNLEINQLLHERVMGECWHEIEPRDDGNLVRDYCIKCETFGVGSSLADYTNWPDYGPMLEVAMTKEWWNDFAYYSNGDFKISTILNPLRGSTAMAEFVKERVI